MGLGCSSTTMSWAPGRILPPYTSMGCSRHMSTLMSSPSGQTFCAASPAKARSPLSDGKQVNVQWDEGSQGFTITGYSDGGTTSPPGASGGVGQFVGTWEFISGQITQTYTFGNPEPCWVNLSNSGLQCVQDYNTLATLGPDTMTGYTSPYEYALIHSDGETCRAFFLDEPTDGVVEGDYGATVGSCLDPAVVNAIARQVYSGNYPATGMRLETVASGNVCTTRQGLIVEGDEEEQARWDITNVCSPQHGYPNVLHIDITPLETDGFFIDIDEIEIRQGGRTWIYDYGDGGTALWADRDTGTSIDYINLPYRLSETPYRTMLLLGQDTGLDLSQPFTLYYFNGLVATFE